MILGGKFLKRPQEVYKECGTTVGAALFFSMLIPDVGVHHPHFSGRRLKCTSKKNTTIPWKIRPSCSWCCGNAIDTREYLAVPTIFNGTYSG